MNIVQVSKWSHHRAGWGYALEALRPIHAINIPVLDWVEGAAKQQLIPTTNWIGFSHNVIRYPSDEYRDKYQVAIPSLEKLIKHADLSSCIMMIVFSQHVTRFLEDSTNLNVKSVLHPTPLDVPSFDMDRFITNPNSEVLMIGQWMRRFKSLAELPCARSKAFLNCPGSLPSPGIRVIPRASEKSYDDMLTRNIVFLDLYDVSACNTVLECIARNTPLIINRLPANVEYLGENYPLFYDSLEEAAQMCDDDELIESAHIYLKNKDKSQLSIQEFKRSIVRILGKRVMS